MHKLRCRQHTIVCLLALRWKRGRELVHCLYKKLQTKSFLRKYSLSSKPGLFVKLVGNILATVLVVGRILATVPLAVGEPVRILATVPLWASASKVFDFESETTSCPELPGANLTLGAGFFFNFFYGAFRRRKWGYVFWWGCKWTIVKVHQFRSFSGFGKKFGSVRKRSSRF